MSEVASRPKQESVFSAEGMKPRPSLQPILRSDAVKINSSNVIDGLALLGLINTEVVTACFFDPQYRGIMDKMKYGNEGERQKDRSALQQMSEETIQAFIKEINRVLLPSGHLFLWI